MFRDCAANFDRIQTVTRGSRTHDGDISGSSSDGILFPEEKLFVTILNNSEVFDRNPGRLTSRIAELA